MDIRESLRKMGWDDNLIEHYVGKNYKAIETANYARLNTEYIENNNIIYENDKQDYREYIYSDSKKK